MATDSPDLSSQATSFRTGDEQSPPRWGKSARGESNIAPEALPRFFNRKVTGGRMLVVDDNEAGRYALASCLRRAGHEVLEAATGEECLRRAASEDIDVIVLDVKLPDASGIDVCRQLKRSAATASIPVIQTSAFLTQTSDRIEGLESGADAYLTAPFEPRELLAHASGLLRARQTEKELRSSEQKYRGLFNSLDEGFFLIDVVYDAENRPVDLQYVEANAAATRILGRDYTGRRLKEIDPNYEPYWFEIFGQVALTGESVRMERYAAPDKRWYNFYVFKVGDAAGRRIGTIFQDISVRKHREANAAFLVEVADELARLRSAEEIMQKVGARIGAYLRVERCTLCEIKEDREELAVLSAWTNTDAPDVLRKDCLSDLYCKAFREANGRGETIAIANTQTDPRTRSGACLSRDIFTFVSVPFHNAEGWRNSLVITGRGPREWRHDEIELVHELANRIFPRIERARAEELLSSIYSGVEAAITLSEAVEHGKSFRFLSVNRATVEWTGIPIERWVGNRPEDLLTREQAAAVTAHYREAMLAGKSISYEEQLSFPAQSCWALTTVSPLRDADGKVRRVLATSVNITEQKRAEEALRESELFYRQTLESIPGMVFTTRPDGYCEYQSQQWVDYTGVPMTEHLGDGWNQLLHPDDQPRAMACWNAAVNTGAPYDLAYRVRRHDGQYEWFKVIARPIKNQAGKIVRWFGVAANIDELKRVENALKESEERFRAIFESTSDCILVWDRDYNYLYANHASIDHVGTTRANVIGKNIRDGLGHVPDFMRLWMRRVDRAFASGKSFRVEDAVGVGDRVVLSESQVSPIRDANGQVFAVGVVYRDVSERKRAEEALKRSSQRFELLSRTVSSLLTASHPQKVVERLCNEVRTFLKCDVFFNFLVDRQTRRLRLNACGGIAPRLARKVEDLELNESLCGTAAQGACRVHVENLGKSEDPRGMLVRSLGIQAYACHPLLTHDGEAFGTLSFGTRSRDRFSDEDLELMKTVTDHVAVAMLRQQAEEAVREALERYEGQVRLFEGVASTTPDFVYVFDLQGRFLYANRRLLSVWGMSLEQVIGRTCRELGYEQWHHDMHMREIAQVIQTRKPIKGEVPFKAPLTGIFGVYEYIFTPVIGGDGEVEVIAGTTRDVTERKRTEEALKESEERLRQAADLVGLCPFTWNVQTHELSWDPRIKPMWGLPADATVDLSVWKSGVHPDDLPMVEDRVARSLDPRGDGLYEAEYRVNGADGVQRWISTRGRTSFEAGKPALHLGVVVEITGKKRIEEALRESEERFRTLANSTSVLIWVHSSDGGLLFVNRAWTDFFGVTLDQVAGGKWKPLVHPDDISGYVDEFLKCHAERRKFSGQDRVKRHDGQWRWVESIAKPRFSGTGEYLGMAGSSVDITARKEAEAVLARNKEELERLVAERTSRLQELVAELEHFSYTITHDMRAPLRAMRGLAEIMTEEDTECSEEERRKFTRRIITAAERMDGLITDALQYSKMVRQELPLAPVDVGKLLRGMLDTYPEFQTFNADIRIAEDLPVVMGNEAGLTQCFSNLLGNATRFVRPGQKPEVRVRAEMREGWVRLWVEDNGIGISPAMRPRVFEMFSRGSSPEAGTGIGLALVRKVVDRMGGRVGVESEPGKGSRFWVELRPKDLSGIAVPSVG